MSKPPKVSVVMPCFNHGEFIPEAVASVLATKRDDVEIVVVDDGSTDEGTRKETDTVAAQGITVIRKQNGGPASARNAAVTVARGEYIFPLDADDHMRPDCLDREVPILDANPQVGVVYSDGEFFGIRSGRWNIGPFDANRLLQWNYIPCCALFRRRIWAQIGGYDEADALRGLEDWDFWLGAMQHGWQFAYVPEVLYEYRVAKESMITCAQSYQAETEKLIATKYGPLYRKELLQTVSNYELERQSGRAALRNLRRIVRARLKERFRLNGNHR